MTAYKIENIVKKTLKIELIYDVLKPSENNKKVNIIHWNKKSLDLKLTQEFLKYL
jgi:hypothetical protein